MVLYSLTKRSRRVRNERPGACDFCLAHFCKSQGGDRGREPQRPGSRARVPPPPPADRPASASSLAPGSPAASWVPRVRLTARLKQSALLSLVLFGLIG